MSVPLPVSRDPVLEMEVAERALDAQGAAAVRAALRSAVRQLAGRAGGCPGLLEAEVDRAVPLWLELFPGCRSPRAPVGAATGEHLARRAGTFLGLELEGLSTEDRELAVARRIVRDLAARTASPARESRRIARPEERGIGVMTTYGYEAPYGQEIGEAEWAAGQFGEFDAGEYADQFDADCKARVNRRVVSQAVVIATGVAADGHREVLGFRRRLRGRRLLDRVPALAQGPRCDQHPARRL